MSNNISDKTNESIYVGKLLNVMAVSLNSELTTFSSWMVAGFGGVIGLLIANIEKVSPYISANTIGASIKLFLLTVIIHVVQRYISAIIAASIAAGKEAEAIPITASTNISSALSGIESAIIWPVRLIVRWSNRRVLAGDFALAGRLNARLAQAQGWLVFAQVIIVARAVWVIASALNG